MPQAGIECRPEKMLSVFRRVPRSLAAVVFSALALVVLGGCAVKHPTASLVQGKILFSQKCGSCHTLAHANASGTTGPNLDDMFAQPRADGEKSTSIEGLVSYWIKYPNRAGVMPGGLFHGQNAEDVAAYVAAVAAKPGKDTGALASAGGVSGTTPAAGKQVFTGVGGCGSCHTLANAATTGVTGPNLDKDLRTDCATARSKQVRGKTITQCLMTAIVRPYVYIPAGYKPGVMPANFDQTLKKNEITALVNYLAQTAK
jgi:mono/diheme cytochrome c family protein